MINMYAIKCAPSVMTSTYFLDSLLLLSAIGLIYHYTDHTTKEVKTQTRASKSYLVVFASRRHFLWDICLLLISFCHPIVQVFNSCEENEFECSTGWNKVIK